MLPSESSDAGSDVRACRGLGSDVKQTAVARCGAGGGGGGGVVMRAVQEDAPRDARGLIINKAKERDSTY